MARISVGSLVSEGKRRGKVVAHRPQGMVDVRFSDVSFVERRKETGLRRRNSSGTLIFFEVDLDGDPTGRAFSPEQAPRGLYYRKKKVSAKEMDAIRSAKSKRAVLKQFYRTNPKDVYDPDKEQFRRQVLALFEKFTSEGYSKTKSVTIKVGKKKRTFQAGQAIPVEWAKPFAFQIATRRGQKYGYLEKGTQTSTEKGKKRAAEKLDTPDSMMKRQRYEMMLSSGRKSGKYRVVPEQKDGRTRYTIQPSGKWFSTETKAQGVVDKWNAGKSKPREAARRVANPREIPVRQNWLPVALGITASVATLGDIAHRRWKGRKKDKKGKKNPRALSELGGMRHTLADTSTVIRNSLTAARRLGALRGKLELQLAQVPDSKKIRFQTQRAHIRRSIEDVEAEYRKLESGAKEVLTGGEFYGSLTQSQKRDIRALRSTYSKSAHDILLAQERKRKGRRGNPKDVPSGWAESATGRPAMGKKRMRGIVKSGEGAGRLSQAKGTGRMPDYPPQLSREGDVYLLSYEGKSNKIPRVLKEANTSPGLRGPRWKTWAKKGDAQPTRYAIQWPKSGRGSKSDPYRIVDKEKKKYLRATFTKRSEAEEYLRKKQGRATKEYIGYGAYTQLTVMATTSKSRAAYVANNLSWLDVQPGVFTVAASGSKHRREAVGQFRIHDATDKPPAAKRGRFHPGGTYTLVTSHSVPFANKHFDSPAAAVKFALSRHIEQEGHGPTIGAMLQALHKRLPDYDDKKVAVANLHEYLHYLGVYGYEVSEETFGKGRDTVIERQVISAPSRKKGSKLPTQGQAQRHIDKLQGDISKIEDKLDRVGYASMPRFILLAHGKGGRIELDDAKGYDLYGTAGSVLVSLSKAPRVDQMWKSSAMEKKYKAQLKDWKQRKDSAERAYDRDMTAWERLSPRDQKSVRKPQRPEAKPVPKGRGTSQGDFDKLSMLISGQAGLSKSAKQRLQSQYEARGLSELRAEGTYRSPADRQASKGRALESQFRYRQRDKGKSSRTYVEDLPALQRPKRGKTKRKMTQEQRERMAELEARYGNVKENWAGALRGAWAASRAFAATPMGKRVLTEVAIVGTMVAGDRLMKKGKVSPSVVDKIQDRLGEELGRRPSTREVRSLLKGMDTDQDGDLTDSEVTKLLKRIRS